MLSENKVKEIYLSKMRNFIATERLDYLNQMKVVGKILEIDDKEEEKIFMEEQKKYLKEREEC